MQKQQGNAPHQRPLGNVRLEHLYVYPNGAAAFHPDAYRQGKLISGAFNMLQAKLGRPCIGWHTVS